MMIYNSKRNLSKAVAPLAVLAGVALTTLGLGTQVQAALITFDDVVTGETEFGFDGDGDGVDDVIFSTTDPSGFNTSGPGANQTFIDEPGLEGTSLLNPDLRVDFLVGAKDFLRFGFALNSVSENPSTFTSFEVFNSNDQLIASDFELGLYTMPDGINPSSFPEGQIEVVLAQTAAYALFDFSSDFGRFIIDNFEGTFGTTEIQTPEPTSMISLLTASFLGGSLTLKRKHKK